MTDAQTAYLNAFREFRSSRRALEKAQVPFATYVNWCRTSPEFNAAFAKVTKDLSDLIEESIRKMTVDSPGYGPPKNA